MPCYETEAEKRGYTLLDPNQSERDRFLNEGPSKEWLIGALCATLTEVQARLDNCGAFNTLVHDMERNGNIAYIGLWFYHHTQDDIRRLKQTASNYKFSEHEKQLMIRFSITKDQHAAASTHTQIT